MKQIRRPTGNQFHDYHPPKGNGFLMGICGIVAGITVAFFSGNLCLVWLPQTNYWAVPFLLGAGAGYAIGVAAGVIAYARYTGIPGRWRNTLFASIIAMVLIGVLVWLMPDYKGRRNLTALLVLPPVAAVTAYRLPRREVPTGTMHEEEDAL